MRQQSALFFVHLQAMLMLRFMFSILLLWNVGSSASSRIIIPLFGNEQSPNHFEVHLPSRRHTSFVLIKSEFAIIPSSAPGESQIRSAWRETPHFHAGGQ